MTRRHRSLYISKPFVFFWVTFLGHFFLLQRVLNPGAGVDQSDLYSICSTVSRRLEVYRFTMMIHIIFCILYVSCCSYSLRTAWMCTCAQPLRMHGMRAVNSWRSIQNQRTLLYALENGLLVPASVEIHIYISAQLMKHLSSQNLLTPADVDV